MSETFNLDQVAGELNSKSSGSDDVSATARLDQWLASLVHRYGSDLLLVEGAPPCIRKDGEVRKIEKGEADIASSEERPDAGVGTARRRVKKTKSRSKKSE